VDIVQIYMDKHIPTAGNYFEPDGNSLGEVITAPYEWDIENDFCQFRYAPYNVAILGWNLAVNVKVTGKPHALGDRRYKSRCKMEFIDEDGPSTFAGGWLYHD